MKAIGRRELIARLGSYAAAAPLLEKGVAAQAVRPNILILMTDQQRAKEREQELAVRAVFPREEHGLSRPWRPA